MGGSGRGGRGGGACKNCLLHLHLAVESHAVLVRHMPETNENKAFIASHMISAA